MITELQDPLLSVAALDIDSHLDATTLCLTTEVEAFDLPKIEGTAKLDERLHRESRPG